jgi:hypothetical protein
MPVSSASLIPGTRSGAFRPGATGRGDAKCRCDRPCLIVSVGGRGHWVYVYYDYTDCSACHLYHLGDRRFL